MIAGQILFYLFGSVALVSALLVVTLQNLVRSIFLFLLPFLHWLVYMCLPWQIL